MFLLKQDARYSDVYERAVYNAMLSGIALTGETFFYPNPLLSLGQHERSPWFACACCPSNLPRFLLSVPGHAYATAGDSVYVNLFVQGRARIPVPSGDLVIEQQTRYQWDGDVRMTVSPARFGRFPLHVRVPGWAMGHPVPGYLYRDLAPVRDSVTLKVNGLSDPTPTIAPVIVFNHGWSAFFPFYYKEWIVHLVKRENIVVFPRYQLTPLIGSRTVTQNAIHAVQQAIMLLQNGDHVTPDLERFALVGHSLGGGITAEMAALATQHGLPQPQATMPVQPYVRTDTMMDDFHEIPPSTLLLVIVGENDSIVGNASGRMIFSTADQIPLERKDFIIQRTDRHGEPALVADHAAPLCFPRGPSVNAMDYFSTWKLFDALTEYAFFGVHQEYCLGDTPEQRFMGFWSDGVPVQELIVTDSP